MIQNPGPRKALHTHFQQPLLLSTSFPSLSDHLIFPRFSRTCLSDENHWRPGWPTAVGSEVNRAPSTPEVVNFVVQADGSRICHLLSIHWPLPSLRSLLLGSRFAQVHQNINHI